MQPMPGPPALAAQPAVVPPAEAIRSWNVADVQAFLAARDLRGIANVCLANDVNGEDYASFDEEMLVADLRLTRFQAKKLLAARAAFYEGKVGDGRSAR